MCILVSLPVQRRPYFTNTVTLIRYINTVRRYGYGVSTCPTAHQKDHYFCRKSGDSYSVIYSPPLVHSRKQIERMTPDEFEGELIAKLFVL